MPINICQIFPLKYALIPQKINLHSIKMCEIFITILNVLLLVCIYSPRYRGLNINCAAIERVCA